MTTTKHIPDKATTQLGALTDKLKRHLPVREFFILATALLILSIICSVNLSSRMQLLTVGEVAKTDVLADKTFLFEDTAATKAKKAHARQMQPLACDLYTESASHLRNVTSELFININNALTDKDKILLQERLSSEYPPEVSLETINTLANAKTQEKINESVITPLLHLLNEGVLPDLRTTLLYKDGGITILRPSGDESLHPDPLAVPDLKSAETLLSRSLKELDLPPSAKKLLSRIITQNLQPSLTPNFEVTQQRSQAAESTIEPVMERVLKGEIIVRQGEKVNKEQQLKMQTLLRKKEQRFDTSLFIGVALCGLLLSSGLLFSPSGKPVSPMQRRDYLFIAGLVASFSLLAKGLFSLGLRLAESSPTFTPESLAFAVPVAGAAAISSLVFSTRRYLVTGLLLAFFCTVMSSGGLGLFLYYFLGAMWSTWLTLRTQSRQDMVRTIFPLTFGLLALWLGATLLQGGSHVRYSAEALAVCGGSFLSLCLTFAFAPFIEMAFGYTTRFRLMELLNLDQPLLRDLMVKAPGTYHHSLIISNMVEAAAKAIGAHSLLCKVAALYHDIGKTNKAVYFIENQFHEGNPHDKLTPSMSALILTSHVKQGTELAAEHRLGTEVTDIIKQHHGTGVIRFFYQKALQAPDTLPPKIEDFSYPGPKPQSKEAALVMLADIVEASSRTLDEPTPNRLRAHIDTMIKNIYADGQLDEAELTFSDLHKVAESFSSVLRGIFHHRIIYPDKTDSCKQGQLPANGGTK